MMRLPRVYDEVPCTACIAQLSSLPLAGHWCLARRGGGGRYGRSRGIAWYHLGGFGLVHSGACFRHRGRRHQFDHRSASQAPRLDSVCSGPARRSRRLHGVGFRETHRPARCLCRHHRSRRHLLAERLYDAALDGAPVVALTGLTFHDLRGPLSAGRGHAWFPEHRLAASIRRRKSGGS